MKTAVLARCALGITAAGVLLAACGGGSSLAPMRQNANATDRYRGDSWMSPAAKSHDLLYISDEGNQAVYVYSYPGAELQGTLTGFMRPVGECADKAGDVFIVDETASQIFEYGHGGNSPIATLNDPGYSPGGCSVDPTTGTLAVTNYSRASGNGQGNVAVYKHLKGNPSAYYTDPNIALMVFCGYDSAGNLFVDAVSFASAFAFAELPKGSSSFRDITLNQPIQSPAGVQWDGKHMAVGDAITSVIYQFAIKGKKGTEVGSTPLIGSANVGQFWIQQSQVVGPEVSGADAGIWQYPRGGPVKKTITGLSSPVGATISDASK
jgi:hypothetical protein